MNIHEVRRQGIFRIVTCSGDLTAGRWADEIRKEFEGSGVLVLDLSGVSYVNSSGFRRILELNNHVAQYKGELVLTGAQKTILGIIQTIGLHKVVPVFPTMNEVFDAYKASPDTEPPPPPEKEELDLPGVLDNTDGAVLVVNAQGNVVFANPQGWALVAKHPDLGFADHAVTELSLPQKGGGAPARILLHRAPEA